MTDDDVKNNVLNGSIELSSLGWELFTQSGNPAHYLLYKKLKSEEEREKREKLR
ncbi:MAG: hypothetical protein IKC64_00355 [Clostridia bacterium]|nr:hypothetical protein [Clostridia bacterium]